MTSPLARLLGFLLLFGTLVGCRSTTDHKRLGVTVPLASDVVARRLDEREDVKVQGLGLALEFETSDQLWAVYEVAGRVYEFDETDLFPRSTELAASLVRELGPLSGDTQPFVEAGLRRAEIYDGVGEHWSLDVGGGLRHRVGPRTNIELGLVHAFSIKEASHDRQFDGWLLQFGLLFDF